MLNRFRYTLDTSNQAATLTWLSDLQEFHKWFTSVIIGSFVLLTIFGNKPGFGSIGPQFLSAALVLLLFAILCNLVCVWSIPVWKYRIATGTFSDALRLNLELKVPAWLGVIAFVTGLTLGFVGNLPP